MYVAGEDALDQFFCRHPTEFLERPVERAILDHESEQIHEAHLAAAAYELPLTPEDGEIFGPRWEEHARRLVQQGALRERGGRYLPRGPGYPAARIALRSASPDSVAIVEADGGEVIGTVETARAHSAVHPGAVYLHMGAAYEVEELDLAQHRAVVRPFNGDWYTQPKKESETWIEQVRDQRHTCGVTLSFGVVSVTEQVVAYQKKSVSDHSVLDLLAVDMPEQDFVTQALWYELPDSLVREEFPLEVLQGSLHAAEHGQIAVLPLIAMCDRWDIGGLSTAYHHQTGVPTIFIYDGHPGGVGHHARRLRALRGAGGRRAAADLGVPVRERLPLVRAVAEVRQPERAAQQARRDRAAVENGGRLAPERAAGGLEHGAAVPAGGLVELDGGRLGRARGGEPVADVGGGHPVVAVPGRLDVQLRAGAVLGAVLRRLGNEDDLLVHVVRDQLVGHRGRHVAGDRGRRDVRHVGRAALAP